MGSSTCQGSNELFQAEYHSRTAATVAAGETQMKYGHKLTPYECRACGYWHLGVVNTRLQCMQCTDSGLFLKDLYASRTEAQSTADYLRKERKIQLYPYKCPHSNGWHLTKTDPTTNKKGRR